MSDTLWLQCGQKAYPKPPTTKGEGMSEMEIRQLAEEHWGFIRDFLNKENEDGLIRIETVHFLYVEAMVHGAKHEREVQP